MSDFSPIRGGAQIDALAGVSADQVTIIGNGTSRIPLQAVTGSSLGDPGTFRADFSDITSPLPGQPVFVNQLTPNFNLCRVELADASAVPNRLVTQVVGLIESAENAIIRYSGVVDLTEDQWLAVTGVMGGLSPGSTYYLFSPAGMIFPSPPVVSGYYVAKVGIALSSTKLLLSQMPCVPRIIL